MSKTKTRNAKSNYYKESLTYNFKNPKQFWHKIKTINTSGERPINKIRAVNTIIHNSLFIAKTFNQHFSAVCSSLLPESYLTTGISSNNLSCGSCFSFKKISPPEVQNAINKLKWMVVADLME